MIEAILLVDPRVVGHRAGEEALHEGLAADAGDVRPDGGHRGRRDQDQGQGRPHRGDHRPLTGDCAVPTSPRPAISCDLEICDVDWSLFSSRVTTPGPARYQDTAMQTLCSVHCCMMVTVRTVQYLASRHAGAVLYPGYSWKRTFAKFD